MVKLTHSIKHHTHTRTHVHVYTHRDTDTHEHEYISTHMYVHACVYITLLNIRYKDIYTDANTK